MSFRLTQLLTRHAVFCSYLARIGKEETTECWFCEALEDDVGHTLSERPRWADGRRRLAQVIGGGPDHQRTGGGSPLRFQGVVRDLALRGNGYSEEGERFHFKMNTVLNCICVVWVAGAKVKLRECLPDG